MESHESSSSPGSANGPPVRLPCEPDEIARDELEQLRAMSLQERGQLLAIACRAAARLDRSRAEAGLSPPAEDPWPKSTWDFLRMQASRHAGT